MKYVSIEIWRGDERLDVDVDVLSFYKGTEAEDDPSSVECAQFGTDSEGKEYSLRRHEVERAEEKFFEEYYTRPELV